MEYNKLYAAMVAAAEAAIAAEQSCEEEYIQADAAE